MWNTESEFDVSTNYREAFLELAVEQGALCFGKFTLKSGRVSPYFFNAGRFNTGKALSRLGQFYAHAIQDSGIEYDMLFGPAYKGIPLVVAAAMSLAAVYGRDVPYAFDRKDAKDHGEGGKIAGAPLSGRVLIIDDVITAGTAVRGAVELIREESAKPVGVAISLDRQECGQGDRSAIQEVQQQLGLKVISIARLDDLIKFVEVRPGYRNHLRSIHTYRERYRTSHE